MTRRLQLMVDDELASLLALYVRGGETPRLAILKSMRLRASADGFLDANGKPKRGVGRITRRPQ